MAQTNDRQPLYDCLAALQEVFDEFGNRAVIIGGIAVGLLARPRATLDVDAMMLLDVAQVGRLLEVAREHGFLPRISEADDFARRSRVVLLKHERTGISVDISLGMLPFETEVVSRAVRCKAGPVSVTLASPEDLVILKAVAHRPMDLLDIRSMIEAHPNLDAGRVERWVREFAEALEMPEIWEDIAAWFDRPAESAP